MALRKFTSREIGNNIRKIRIELRESQEEFGKRAGDYSQNTVAKWEAGQIPPAMILKVIGKRAKPKRSVDWILGDEGETDEDIDEVLARLSHGVERAKELTGGKGRKKVRPRDRKS